MFILFSSQAAQQDVSQLPRNDITRVCQSKRELFGFLVVEMEYYLPDI